MLDNRDMKRRVLWTMLALASLLWGGSSCRENVDGTAFERDYFFNELFVPKGIYVKPSLDDDNYTELVVLQGQFDLFL